MSDVATSNLKKVINGDEYVLLESRVPLFDEHDEYDKDGKLVRKFGKTELQRIVTQCNNRARNTGDLAPFGPGHTKDSVQSEEDQPPVWGFYHNYSLGRFGPAKKLAVLADCYVKREITTKDGKTVDGCEYARSFPRRSIELWPGSMTIDWVAHLRRSPQRDLGLLAYSRADYQAVFTSPRSQVASGAILRSGKLRYQMESAMDNDQVTPADAPNLDVADEAPEGHEDFARHMDYWAKKNPEKFAAFCGPKNAALPGGTPGGDDDDIPPIKNGADESVEDEEALRNFRGRNGVRPHRFQQELDTVTKDLANEKKLRMQREHETKMLRFERTLSKLQESGIELDIQDELLECGAMDDAKFDAHVKRIRKNYQRSVVGPALPDGLVNYDLDTGEDPIVKHADEIIKYARDNNFAEKYGANSFMEAAKVLKYAK